MSIKHFPFLIAGEATTTDSRIAIRNPFDGRIVATVSEADQVHIESAIAAASAVATEFASTPVHIRADALIHISTRLNDRHEEIAQLISAESGKPIKWARVEVTRAATTFRWAAEEARRWSGHMQRLDTDAGSDGRLALVHRVPRGPILGIAPFNFPLNLVAHKVAPALAVGAPIIVKPAPATPLSSLVLGELLAETSLPEGAWSVLTVSNEKASEMVQDPRLPVVSFTGSVPVGGPSAIGCRENTSRSNWEETPPSWCVKTGPMKPDRTSRPNELRGSRCTKLVSPASRCSEYSCTTSTTRACGNGYCPGSACCPPVHPTTTLPMSVH